MFSLEGRSLSLESTLHQAFSGISFAVPIDVQLVQQQSPLRKSPSSPASPLSSIRESDKFCFSPVRGESGSEELACLICHETVVDPVETPCCRRLFCRERCLLRPGVVAGKCPCCSKDWTANQLLEPSKSILGILSKVRVCCDKCKEIVFRGSKGDMFIAHLRTCKGKEAPSVNLQGHSGSIQHAIRRGELGKLLEALDEIRSHLVECNLKIEFPTVVVCGQESTGKSSVLERICMFPFFPRGHGITTRMPINLRLRHKNLEELEDFCKKLNKRFVGHDTMVVRISFRNISEADVFSASNPGDASSAVEKCQAVVLKEHLSNKSFCSEPLVLEAWGESLPDLDVVDLPGVYAVKVQNESFDIVEQTRKITEEYLNRQSTLVVAVVPATTERIRNDVVLGMVQRAGKESATVCALTKADKCFRSEYSDRDPFMDLKERARGKADDCPLLGGGFVALRNRDSRESEQLSLTLAADRERSWFQTHMPDLVEEGCATADCLVNRIGELMIRYTYYTWSPQAIRQIDEQVASVTRKIEALGEDPNVEPETFLSKLLTEALKHSDLSWESYIEQLLMSCCSELQIDRALVTRKKFC